MRLIPSLAAVALLALPVTAMAKPATKQAAPSAQVHKTGKRMHKARTAAPSKVVTPAPTTAPAK